MGRPVFATVALLLGFAACTDNTAPGNDREARLDPPKPAAERAAASSLAQLDPGLLKPESMTDADVASLSPGAGTCLFRYTEVGLPIFLYPADGAGAATIKLNGKLIELPPAGGSAFADGGIRVEMNHPDGLPEDGQEEAELILRMERASDELGFRGVTECRQTS